MPIIWVDNIFLNNINVNNLVLNIESFPLELLKEVTTKCKEKDKYLGCKSS